MILIEILVLYFALWLFYDYKRGVLMITAWLLALEILNLLGGRMTAFQFLAFLACVLGVFHYSNGKIKNSIPYPFGMCVIPFVISLFITNVVSSEHHWLQSIINVVCTYVFPFFVWNALNNPRNMRRFVRYTVIFLMFLVGYGIFEVISNSNPIMEWLTVNEYSSAGLSDTMRYGLKRIQSFLTYSSTLGVCCIMNILFLGFVNIKYRDYLKGFSRLVPYLIIGLYLCAFFTGTRSAMIATVIGSLYFVRWRMFQNRWTWVIIVLAIFIAPFVLTYFQEVLQTFEDTESASGSSIAMRQGQFELAFQFLNKSFWFGNGIGYTYNFVTENFRDVMYGAESMWIPMMIDQGIVGVVAYLTILFVSFRYCMKFKNYAGVFIIIVFIVAKTLGMIPGMNSAYFLLYVIVTCRLMMYTDVPNVGFDQKIK